jgi:hypothetical protein
MKNVELSFAKPIINLMAQLVDADGDMTDSIASVKIVGLKGPAAQALEVAPAELVGAEGREWVKSASVDVPNIGKFGIEVDTQTGTTKLHAGQQFEALTLVIGVELENLNQRPA